jgi:hypothetical protein
MFPRLRGEAAKGIPSIKRIDRVTGRLSYDNA